MNLQHLIESEWYSGLNCARNFSSSMIKCTTKTDIRTKSATFCGTWMMYTSFVINFLKTNVRSIGKRVFGWVMIQAPPPFSLWKNRTVPEKNFPWLESIYCKAKMTWVYYPVSGTGMKIASCYGIPFCNYLSQPAHLLVALKCEIFIDKKFTFDNFKGNNVLEFNHVSLFFRF